MKVRVKATGEIKEVAQGIYSPYQYVDNEGTIYTENDIEKLPGDDGAIFFDTTIDYWTRLEHQYAGMAMQGILANSAFDEVSVADIAITSIKVATSLIKRLKEERK